MAPLMVHSLWRSHPRGFTGRLLRFSACVAALSTEASCQRGVPAPALVQLDDAQRIAADLRVAFTRAAGASDRAVMSETDESITFAREADQGAATIESDVRALVPKLASLAFDDEARTLQEISQSFAEYRKLDGEVLRLAVENTNLKAQHLSFGPIREAADSFQASLDAIARGTPAKDRCRAEALAARATLALREIQVLQAPHIAEAADPKMDRLEKDMARLRASAHDALSKLGGLVVPATRPALTKANATLGQFETVAGQLVALSRRNSNVRSLALALGPKAALGAKCEASLNALAQALAKEGSIATR
jgi:hypothetical protein